MARKKGNKFYTVWKGHTTGVFKTWAECQLQIKNFKGCQYKSFSTEEKAQEALRGEYKDYLNITPITDFKGPVKDALISDYPASSSIAVDAASSGNPGTMEYRGVDIKTKKVLFHKGPFKEATNNIGEFLALVHGLAFLKQQRRSCDIYSDSRTAIKWVSKKKCNTSLTLTKNNQNVFELISKAEKWLKKNSVSNRILKWETKKWGEVPADFGRK